MSPSRPPPRTASTQELLSHGPGGRTSSRGELADGAPALPPPRDDDLEVTIDEEGSSPTTAAKQQQHVPAAGKQWPKWLDSPKKRRLAAGAALLPLVLVPLIVGPVVAAQNKNNGGRAVAPASSSSSSSSSPLSLASGGDAGLLPTDEPDDVGTLKVPKRVAPPARLPRRAKPDGRLPPVEPEVVSPFASVRKGQFDKFCRPFYPVGFNGFELVMLAATNQRKLVDDAFEQARALGLNTARTWAHSITPAFPFQTSPGKYDPEGVEALDYVLDSAARHGISVILSFADNWKYYNGVDQYVDWSSTAPARSMQRPVDNAGGDSDEGKWSPELRQYEAMRRASFWVDPGARKLYKDHINYIVNRKNSINGRVYKNDPTILAWNLVNEPRCETNVKASCTDDLNAWTRDVAAYVKAADPNHLVTTGYEGFFGPSDPAFTGRNPEGQWPLQTGQDFVRNLEHVDYGTVHSWASQWNVPDDRQAQFIADWMQAHLQAAQKSGKPVMMEEFGKLLTDEGAIAEKRDPVFRAVYKAIEDAIQDSQPLVGSLYWQWYFDGARFPNGGSISKAPYGVSASDSTTTVIRDHARRLNRLMNQVPPRPGCSFSNATDPTADAAPLGVWFPNPDTKTCINNPEAGYAWHLLYGPDAAPGATADQFGFSPLAAELADALEAGKTLSFPSEAACCRGAFAEGCAGEVGSAAAAPRAAPKRRFF